MNLAGRTGNAFKLKFPPKPRGIAAAITIDATESAVG